MSTISGKRILIERLRSWDNAGIRWMIRRRQRFVTLLMRVLSGSGTAPAWCMAGAILIAPQLLGISLVPLQGLFIKAMIAGLPAWIISKVLKKVIARKRPHEVLGTSVASVAAPANSSFPSAHSASAAAFAAALALTGHPWSYGVTLWAGAVAFSRYYLGVHFLSDIAGGVVLGSFCGIVLQLFFYRI